jgi:hypothetical protein
MSIINEALKKAEKEIHPQTEHPARIEDTIGQNEIGVLKASKKREANFLLGFAIVGIVLSAIILSSIVLIKNLNLFKIEPEISKTSVTIESIEGSLDDSSKPGDISRVEKAESPIELTGIIYETEDRWAIINNRIVRQGETVGNEKVVEIGKDYVKLVNETTNVERSLKLR